MKIFVFFCTILKKQLGRFSRKNNIAVLIEFNQISEIAVALFEKTWIKDHILASTYFIEDDLKRHKNIKLVNRNFKQKQNISYEKLINVILNPTANMTIYNLQRKFLIN